MVDLQYQKYKSIVSSQLLILYMMDLGTNILNNYINKLSSMTQYKAIILSIRNKLPTL